MVDDLHDRFHGGVHGGGAEGEGGRERD